jgi:LacI family transcriptional regulator
MPVRLRDVANRLGISTAAVCKALKGHKDISEATRQRVLECVRELNYQPNLLARGLSVGRSKAIGLVIPELMHSFFAEIAHGVTRQVQSKQYTLLLADSEENPEAERQVVELLLARRVDGLVIASAQSQSDLSLFEELQRREVPFVLLDRRYPAIKAHFVGIDNLALGRLATEHLLNVGCRHVAHISCTSIATGPGRLEGYLQALEAHDGKAIPSLIVDTTRAGTESVDAAAYQAMRQLLASRPRPDGVFCFNDPIAANAIKATLDAGLRVPQDVAIVGAGNVHYSDLLRVPLTTVDQSPAAMGAKAAEILLQLIESGGSLRPADVFIPLNLVERESTRRSRGMMQAGKGGMSGA